jgi:hypothetical protein
LVVVRLRLFASAGRGGHGHPAEVALILAEGKRELNL